MMAKSPSDRCPTCGRRHKRSNPQNGLLWLLYHQMAAKDWGGQRYSADSFHAYYKSKFLGVDDVKLPNGKTITEIRSTANLDVAEFSAYFDAVQADCAERGVYLADMESA